MRRPVADAGGGGGGGGGAAGARTASGRRTYGGVLVLRNMDTGTEERLADVSASTFDDSAKVLAYTVTSRDSTKDGVFVRDMATGQTRTIITGQGNYRALAFDRTQQNFVFTSDKDDFGKEHAKQTIYLASLKTGVATPVITPGMWPNDMRLPDNGGAPAFTKAGNAIVFQMAPPP